MSRKHDPLLGTELKQAATGSTLHWTDIAILTVIAKANEALQEASLNIPRCLDNAFAALGTFAAAPSHEQEKNALEQYMRDLKQIARHANRCERRAAQMYKRVIRERYTEATVPQDY